MYYLIILSLTMMGSACNSSDSSNDNPSALTGTDLFELPHSDGNTFACSTCHAVAEPSSDGFTRPGHSLKNAANRSSFKNGNVSSLLESVNSCREEWMNATAYDSEDSNWQLLQDYLTDLAAGTGDDPIVSTIIDPPASLDGGNSVVGQELFNTSCAICHGSDAVGTDKGPLLAGTSLSASAIAQRVRTSGDTDSPVYDGLTGGRMPFWAEDRLSDSQLIDIIAYLVNSEAPDSTAPSDSLDISVAGAQSSCSANSAKIGQTLTLSTLSHLVSGTVTVVDDCTLRFDNFIYDGGGIDVRMYSGTGGSFASGLAISSDIFGSSYNNQTLILRLPTGISLDDFDSVSVWCVAVGTSFGHGVFSG